MPRPTLELTWGNRVVEPDLAHGCTVLALAFATDDATLWSVDANAILRQWDVNTNALMVDRELAMRDLPRVAAIDAQCGWVALASRCEVAVFDLTAGSIVTRFLCPSPTRALVFEPLSGRLVAVNNDRRVRIFDIRAEHVTKWPAGSAEFTALAVSPDGRSLAICDDSPSIAVCDVESQVLVSRYDGHNDPATACAFSPDGRLVASASRERDGPIHVWESGTGARVDRARVEDVRGRESSLFVCFTLHGVVSAGGWQHLRLFDSESDEPARSVKVAQRHHSGRITAGAVSSSGDCVALANSAVTLWSLPKLARQYGTPVRNCVDIAIGPNGDVLANYMDGMLWARDGRELCWAEARGSRVAFVSDGFVVAVRRYGQSGAFGLRYGDREPTWDAWDDRTNCSPIHIPGSRHVELFDTQRRAIEPTSGRQLWSSPSLVHAVAFTGAARSRDGSVITALDDAGYLHVWRNGERGDGGMVGPLRFADGSRLADYRIDLVYDMHMPTPQTVLLLAVERTLTLHDLDGTIRWQQRVPDDVKACGVTADGALVVAIDEEAGSLRAWDVVTGVAFESASIRRGPTAIACHADDPTRVVLGFRDGSVQWARIAAEQR